VRGEAFVVGAVSAFLAVATADPAAAQRQPQGSIGRQDAAHTPPWPILAAHSDRSRPEAAVEPRLQPRECRLAGWILFVVTDGECMSLPETTELAHYADARPGEFDAGFGWRGRRTSLVLGYTDPQDGYIWQDQNPATANLVRPGDPGLFGVSAVVRLR
jgi:hypothetical protein